MSRYLVIVLAFAASLYRLAQGAGVEAAGLFGLGAGLLVLKESKARPAIKPLAYLGFALTAISVATMFLRRR